MLKTTSINTLNHASDEEVLELFTVIEQALLGAFNDIRTELDLSTKMLLTLVKLDTGMARMSFFDSPSGEVMQLIDTNVSPSDAEIIASGDSINGRLRYLMAVAARVVFYQIENTPKPSTN
jgi:hypothetical protein